MARTAGKGCTDDYRTLDIRIWQREGNLVPGQYFSCYWTRGGKVEAQMEGSSRIAIGYQWHNRAGEWQHRSFSIRVDWTSCNYGGKRAWFRCPVDGCGRRVAILYIGNLGTFACRHCRGLAYRSQRETEEDRAHRAANKVRRRLGWMEGIAHRPSGKPKGMHWRTYYRLSMKHNAAAMTAFEWSTKALGLINKRLDRAGQSLR